MNEEKWFGKEIDAEIFYTVIDDLFREVGPPFVLAGSHLIPNGTLWALLVYQTIERGRGFSANPTQRECSKSEKSATAYGPHNIKTTMFGLMTLSWLKINIKKKTENGHCRNPIHEPKENKPTGCAIGSLHHLVAPKELQWCRYCYYHHCLFFVNHFKFIYIFMRYFHKTKKPTLLSMAFNALGITTFLVLPLVLRKTGRCLLILD